MKMLYHPNLLARMISPRVYWDRAAIQVAGSAATVVGRLIWLSLQFQLMVEKMLALFFKKLHQICRFNSLSRRCMWWICLLDTLFNFFKPCKASQDIEAYVQKLNTFGTELSHQCEKSNLTLLFIKSETQKLEAQQQISELKLALVQNKQHYRAELQYQAQKHQDTIITTLICQHKKSFDRQQQQIRKLEDEKKKFKQNLTLAQQQHNERFCEYEDCLKLKKTTKFIKLSSSKTTSKRSSTKTWRGY